MTSTLKELAFIGALALILAGCGTTTPMPRPTPPRPTPTKPTTPPPSKPSDNKPSTPPSGNNGGNSGGNNPTPPNPPVGNSTYKIAVLLPFLTNSATTPGEVPEKSTIAMQYYAGIQMGLTAVSEKTGYPNLVVDVLDTQASDAEFQSLMNTNARLKGAQVVIGPLRNSHITLMAEQAKTTKQIVVSPESPASDLTSANPYFIQTTPPLRAHCSRIIQHLRSEKKRTADQVVLVCKQKEADRLTYFQDANQKFGATRIKEEIVPDASTTFDKVDLKKYLKAGQATAFIMPSWAGADWVMAFLLRLKQQKGSNKVEVYGMPQWADYEQIEPELLTELNVHISSARYIDRDDKATQEFERKFYELFGTLPDEDAYNGYNVVQYLAEQLYKHGLNFPERTSGAPTFSPSLTGGFYMRRVSAAAGGVDGAVTYEYIENIYVQMLKFERFAFRPLEGD